MDIHKNARTLPHSRMLIVERLAASGNCRGVTAKTVRKWRDRHGEGAPGLATGLHVRIAARPLEDAIEALRRQRLSSQISGSAVPSPPSARCSGAVASAACPPSRPPIVRYEREQPGELSTSKSSAASTGSATASPATAPAKATGALLAGASGGNTCTSPSTTARAWLSPNCCPTERKEDAPPSWKAALLGSSKSPSSRHDRQEAKANCSPTRWTAMAWPTNAPAPTHQRPTEKPIIQSSIREWAYATAFNTSAERERAMHPWLTTTPQDHTQHSASPGAWQRHLEHYFRANRRGRCSHGGRRWRRRSCRRRTAMRRSTAPS